MGLVLIMINTHSCPATHMHMGTDNLSGQPIIISNDMTFNFANWIRQFTQ